MLTKSLFKSGLRNRAAARGLLQTRMAAFHDTKPLNEVVSKLEMKCLMGFFLFIS